jgi:hypothetical protein
MGSAIRSRRWLMHSIAALAAAAALGAGASRAEARRPCEDCSFSPAMVSLTVGGGVTDFGRPQYRNQTRLGGTWDVRLMVGTRAPIALEVGYVGTLQRAQGLAGPRASLLGSSVEVLGRINFTRWRVQPFVAGGGAWMNYRVYGSTENLVLLRDFNRSVNGVAIPAAGGITFYMGRHAVLELRFTYRFVPQKALGRENLDLLPRSNQRADDWTAALRVGVAF